MKNQLKICKICKACICILQLYILTYSIRRRHKPKRHAKRKTRLLVWLPSLMRWKISAMWLSYIYIYICHYLYNLLCSTSLPNFFLIFKLVNTNIAKLLLGYENKQWFFKIYFYEEIWSQILLNCCYNSLRNDIFTLLRNSVFHFVIFCL